MKDLRERRMPQGMACVLLVSRHFGIVKVASLERARERVNGGGSNFRAERATFTGVPRP